MGIIKRVWSAYQLAVFNFAAAAATEGQLHLIVQAFAGTGKTTTMVEAVNRMPEGLSILVVTFSNKAKEELQARVTRPGAEANGFNALGGEICRRYMGRLDVDKFRANRIAQAVCGLDTPPDMVKLVADLSSKGKATLPGWSTRERLAAEGTAAKAAGNIALANELRAQWKTAPQVEMEDLAREHDLVPDEQWAADGWDVSRIAKLALLAMELTRVAHVNPADPVKGPQRREAAPSVAHIKLHDRTISFDDQIYLPVANRWVAPRFDRVLVDETQDTSAVQLRLALGLLKAGGQFMAVGDRFQSIYRFRGADSQAMDRIKAKLQGMGGCAELTLPETYRCGKRIVAEAAKLVPGYTAHESNADGEVLSGGYSDMLAAVGPGDFVLSRSNAPLAAACIKLWKMGKRAKVEGREMAEGLTTLVGKMKAKSIPDFLEKLTKWEERECLRVTKAAKSDDEVDAKVEQVHDKADCLRNMTDGVKGLPELTERINSLFAKDAAKEAQVVLMTVHKSKGLEADRVFLLDDTFKAKGKARVDTNSKAKSQDELFIRYVAVTRARSTLAYIHGLEEGPGAGLRDVTVQQKHNAAVTAAATATGDTLESIAQAIENLKQLSEKNPSAEYLQTIKQLEEKQRNMTQAKA